MQVTVTGTRQREAWLRREFPPVEQVRSGIWSVPVPIPDSPLRYVLSYLIEHKSGFIMVDTGWNDPDSWRVLNEGLAACQIPLGAITGVLVTHVHPDHHGLSGKVREQTGAWIAMHEAEAAFLVSQMNRRDADGAARMSAYQRWIGAPPEHLADVTERRAARPGPMAAPDRTLAHGDLADAPGLALRAVWTPGHTPGHLCFHDEARDLLLTGDHVLPRITPNISAWDVTASPLDAYLASLEALRGLNPAEVLPAHEYRFAGLDARLTALIGHHAERLAEIAAALPGPDGAGRSAWQVAARVSWSRPWDQISGFPRQAALGEVVAHLLHMQAQGQVRCTDEGGLGLWSLTADQPVPASLP
jgi:glyoxylase-like metal-dependent hydrolase (beta-lactamase superfamily II)